MTLTGVLAIKVGGQKLEEVGLRGVEEKRTWQPDEICSGGDELSGIYIYILKSACHTLKR